MPPFRKKTKECEVERVPRGSELPVPPKRHSYCLFVSPVSRHLLMEDIVMNELDAGLRIDFEREEKPICSLELKYVSAPHGLQRSLRTHVNATFLMF